MDIAVLARFEAWRGDFDTIGVSFRDGTSKLYRYKALKKDNVKPGEFCIVEVDGAFRMVVVKYIDSEPVLSNHTVRLKWIVQKIDATQYKQLNDEEQRFSIIQRALGTEYEYLPQKPV